MLKPPMSSSLAIPGFFIRILLWTVLKIFSIYPSNSTTTSDYIINKRGTYVKALIPFSIGRFLLK